MPPPCRRPPPACALRPARARPRGCGGLPPRPRPPRVTLLRAPGIYALDRPGGDPRERLRRGTPVLHAADDVHTNHVHADDLARACVAALHRGPAQRALHVSDDGDLKTGDHYDLVARLAGLPPLPRIGRDEAAARFTPMQLSFLGESRRLVNARLKRELRLRLRYPTVVQAFAAAGAAGARRAALTRGRPRAGTGRRSPPRYSPSSPAGSASHMHFSGIATAAPAARYTKADCLAAFRRSDWFARLDRALALHRADRAASATTASRRGGWPSTRSTRCSRSTPTRSAARFLAHAPALAERGRRAARSPTPGSTPADIDAVVVSTCTGYLCPGLSGYVVERLGLRADVQAYDLVGQGCAAALPNLQLGRALLGSGACDARAVGLRRGQQRGDVPRRRPRRADQRLPVRRRRRRRGAVAPRRPTVARRVEWKDERLADRAGRSATR